MGYKKFKTYTEDSDEENEYESPSENDEDNDYYYLKRKEDRIAEIIMKNYLEFINEVSNLL